MSPALMNVDAFVAGFGSAGLVACGSVVVAAGGWRCGLAEVVLSSEVAVLSSEAAVSARGGWPCASRGPMARMKQDDDDSPEPNAHDTSIW